MSCNVCVEPFNKTSRKEITCEFCQYSSCKMCCCQYILTGTQVAHCMNCKVEWNYPSLLNKFPRKFVDTDYSQFKQQILFNREKALLQITLAEMEASRLLTEHKNKIAQKTFELISVINELARSQRPFKEELLNLESLVKNNIKSQQNGKNNYFKKLQSAKQSLKNVRNKMREKRRQLKLLKENNNNIHFNFDLTGQPSHSKTVLTPPVVSFVRKCCSEGCPGFYTTQWRCPVCENYGCSKCHELVGKTREKDSHKCKPENVATAELLNKDSKPCPTCGTLIHKISGCYEMFCTQCHNGFDWKTGKPLKNVHNPHFFEYMRTQGTRGNVERMLYSNDPNNTLYFTIGAKPERIARTLLHMRHVDLNPQINPQTFNRDIRVKLLRGQITQDQFKALLKRRDKRFHFIRENLQVLEMFVQSAINIMLRYNQATTHRYVKSIWNPFQTELYTLRSYTNDCFQTIANTYKLKPRSITVEFEFM